MHRMMYYWFWLSLYAISGIVLLSLGGLVWSPFAAFIAFRRARQRGLAPIRYMFIGALYSILLIIPWFILIGKMDDIKSSTGWAFWILYICWLFGPIAILFLDNMTTVHDSSASHLAIPLGIVMILMWVGSMVWLGLSKEKSDRSVRPAEVVVTKAQRLRAARRRRYEDQRPERGYILPFACAMVSLLATLGLIVLTR